MLQSNPGSLSPESAGRPGTDSVCLCLVPATTVESRTGVDLRRRKVAMLTGASTSILDAISLWCDGKPGSPISGSQLRHLPGSGHVTGSDHPDRTASYLDERPLLRCI